MSKLRLATAADEPPRDLARVDLAAAIARRNELARDCEALAEAEAASRDQISVCRREHTAAEAALREAKQAAAAGAVDRALGRAGDEGLPSPAAARRRLNEAEDALELARSAESARKSRLDEYQMMRLKADERVKRAACRVLAEADSVKNLADKVARLQREMLDATLALEWLKNQSAVHINDSVSAETREAITQASYRLRSPPNSWNGLLNRTVIAGTRPWENALAALCEDADATVPA